MSFCACVYANMGNIWIFSLINFVIYLFIKLIQYFSFCSSVLTFFLRNRWRGCWTLILN